MSLLLVLNRSHTVFWCFLCLLEMTNYQLGNYSVKVPVLMKVGMSVKWQYLMIQKSLTKTKNSFIKLQLRTIQRTHGMTRHLTWLIYTVTYLSLTSLVIKFTKPCRFEINIASLPQYPAKKVEKFLSFTTTHLVMFLQNISNRRSGFIDKKWILTRNWNS